MSVNHFALETRKLYSQLTRYLGATCLVLIALIHFHLWLQGYKNIPVVGILFLLNSITATTLAVVIFVLPKRLVGLLGALFSLATLLSLIESINFGLFGFKDSSRAPFVADSIVVEVVASICLILWWRMTPSRR